MILRLIRFFTLSLGLVLGPLLSGARPDPLSSGDALELPPLMVEAALPGISWQHARIGNFEVLSACSDKITQKLATQIYWSNRLFGALVPEKFQLTTSEPESIVVYPDNLRHALSSDFQKELNRAVEQTGRWAPNLALFGRDSIAKCYLVEDFFFERIGLRLLPSYVRLLMEKRNPALPAWFIEAFCSLSESSRFFTTTDVSAGSLTWISPEETTKIQKNAHYPIALLPMQELFAPHPRGDPADPREQLWKAQAELFVRWAFNSSRASRRKALWAWADWPKDQPADENAFRALFGMGWEDLRAQLTDYLPKATKEELTVSLHDEPDRVEIKPATPTEIARIKGEWEYLSLEYVKRRSPSVAPKYLEQARVTLQRGYDQKVRDPRVTALLGLLEVTAGDDAQARTYLESAAAAGPLRARADFELARLRYLSRSSLAEKLSQADARELLKLLDSARKQSPPLPEVYALFGEILNRSAVPPQAPDLAVLDEGVHFFPAHSQLVFQAAVLNLRYGQAADAERLIQLGFKTSADATTQERFAELEKTVGVK